MINREEFWYDSRDGETKIHAVRWLPECEKPVLIVQIVHGMAEYAMRYEGFAQFLAGKGVLVVANDHLGHGLSRREEIPYGYFCKREPATVVVRDVHRLKKMTQEQNPGIPYFLIGHSMGSFILRNYLMKYGKGIDGAVIVGSGYMPGPVTGAGLVMVALQSVFMGEKHVSKLTDGIIFGGYNKRIKGGRTSYDWLSTQNDEVDAYLADPLCGQTFTLNGFRTLLTLIHRACAKDSLNGVPRKLPVLLLSGREDPVGGYGSGVERVFEFYLKNEMEKTTCRLYDGIRHEILNESVREQVYEDIMTFLLKAADI